MVTTKKYVKLARQIYDLIESEDPVFEDIVAALALVNLWITTDYITMCNEKSYDDN